MFKYTLIISQYYHSRHQFIVKFPEEDFHLKCKNFIEELEKYKRKSDYRRDINFGDIIYLNSDHVSIRYNINDDGDIYIINSVSVANLLPIYRQYALESYKQSRKYIRNQVIEDIGEHHNYEKVFDIVDKYFEII